MTAPTTADPDSRRESSRIADAASGFTPPSPGRPTRRVARGQAHQPLRSIASTVGGARPQNIVANSMQTQFCPPRSITGIGAREMEHCRKFFASQWPRWDSNPHIPEGIRNFKSRASADSATRPCAQQECRTRRILSGLVTEGARLATALANVSVAACASGAAA